jgi:hypothetical protein
MLETSYLRERLRYEPETGALIWLARPGSDREVLDSEYLGLFDTPEAAHARYATAALERYGEFARLQ